LAQQWRTSGAPSRITPVGVSLFRQRRPFGMGFARAFLTPRHIEATGRTPADFWSDVEARCADAAPEQLIGTSYWAVLQFRRGGDRVELPPIETSTLGELAYHGPTEERAPLPKNRRTVRTTMVSDARAAASA
jgi:hypothetical protein